MFSWYIHAFDLTLNITSLEGLSLATLSEIAAPPLPTPGLLSALISIRRNYHYLKLYCVFYCFIKLWFVSLAECEL